MKKQSGITIGTLGLGFASSVSITDFNSYTDLEGIGNDINLSESSFGQVLIFDRNWELHGVSFSGSYSFLNIDALPVDATMDSTITETVWSYNVKNIWNKLCEILLKPVALKKE